MIREISRPFASPDDPLLFVHSQRDASFRVGWHGTRIIAAVREGIVPEAIETIITSTETRKE
ncbi:MAG: hypothetical protein AB7O66_09030 [Limisphaerales bacterium]